jgi:uncharacterized membrane protein YkvA (DUF1232 family)
MTSAKTTTWADRTRALNVVLHLPNFIRLYWRLLRARVSIWPKVVLVAALAYVVLPFDLVRT